MSFDSAQFRVFASKWLGEFDRKLVFDAAIELLLGTCAVESAFGKYLRQVDGPARGIFQMEPDTHNDIWDNFLAFKAPMVKKIVALKMTRSVEALIFDLRYSTIMTRLHYWRVPEKIPEDLEGQAAYWKEHYNTELGRGTIDGYLKAYKRFVT